MLFLPERLFLSILIKVNKKLTCYTIVREKLAIHQLYDSRGKVAMVKYLRLLEEQACGTFGKLFNNQSKR